VKKRECFGFDFFGRSEKSREGVGNVCQTPSKSSSMASPHLISDLCYLNFCTTIFVMTQGKALATFALSLSLQNDQSI
jgi:hypothetical protein